MKKTSRKGRLSGARVASRRSFDQIMADLERSNFATIHSMLEELRVKCEKHYREDAPRAACIDSQTAAGA